MWRVPEKLLVIYLFFASLMIFTVPAGDPLIRSTRFVLLLPLYLYLPGHLISLIFIPPGSRPTDRAAFSLAVSLMLHYLFGLMNILYEGPDNIFRVHLGSYIVIIVIVCAALIQYCRSRGRDWSLIVPNARPDLVLLLLLASALLFTRNGVIDVNADEYDQGFRAYDLFDGPTGMRRAFFISTHDYPPLFFYVSSAFMNLLEPRGFALCSKLALRTGPLVTSLVTLALLYILCQRFFSRRLALVASLLLATSNGYVWMGRILMSESTLTTFSVAAVYFVLLAERSSRGCWLDFAGLFAGCCLLSKASGFFMLPLLFLPAIHARPLRGSIRALGIALICYVPVIIFNIGFYLAMGYTDVFFSKALGTIHPIMGNMRANYHTVALSEKAASFTYLAADLLSPPILAFVLLAVIDAIRGLGPRSPMRGVLLWWVLGVGFFLLLGVRAYYIAPLFPPSMLMLGSALAQRRSWVMAALLAMLVVYSLDYTVSTNFDDDYFVAQGDLGRTGSPHPSLGLQRSVAARSWSRPWGFDSLTERIEVLVRERGVREIIVSPGIRWEVDRWYVHRTCTRLGIRCLAPGDAGGYVHSLLLLPNATSTRMHVESLTFRGNLTYYIAYD